MARTRITIVNVAEAAGVSVKTVSRVINREPHVRQKLIDKVQNAIDQLGFVPNAAARSLAGVRSFMIAAFYDNPSLYYIFEIQSGAMRACRAAGYHLIVEKTVLETPGELANFEQMLRSARLDGVVLSPPVTDDPRVLDRLDAYKIPYVRLSPLLCPDRSPAIYSNDVEGAAAVARHLWQLGHRRMAFVAGPDSHLASSLRHDGFLAELERHGLDRESVEIARGDFSFESGMVAGIDLLGRKPAPTAIFAANDDMAAGVAAAAGRLGVRVPDEISIVGFDDSPIATLIWPPITTIRQPIADMAAEAARMLIAGIGHDSPSIKRFPVRLVERKSTGVNREIVRD